MNPSSVDSGVSFRANAVLELDRSCRRLRQQKKMSAPIRASATRPTATKVPATLPAESKNDEPVLEFCCSAIPVANDVAEDLEELDDVLEVEDVRRVELVGVASCVIVCVTASGVVCVVSCDDATFPGPNVIVDAAELETELEVGEEEDTLRDKVPEACAS